MTRKRLGVLNLDLAKAPMNQEIPQAVVSWCHRYTLFSGCEWLDLASEKSGAAYRIHSPHLGSPLSHFRFWVRHLAQACLVSLDLPDSIFD
jgi:hypothetical protein